MPQTASPSSPLLLTVAEAGRLLGVSRGSAYKLVRAGRLRAVHLHPFKDARVPRAEVERLVAELIAERAQTDGSPAGVTGLPDNSTAGQGRDVARL